MPEQSLSPSQEPWLETRARQLRRIRHSPALSRPGEESEGEIVRGHLTFHHQHLELTEN